MGFAEAVKTCLSKYLEFSGRARRSEFWFFWLFVIVVEVAASIVDSILGSGRLLYSLVGIALIAPQVGAWIRRLHDTGRSGLWLLLALIPILGWIALIVFACQDSKPDNEYGPNPKSPSGATTYTPLSGGYGPPPVA